MSKFLGQHFLENDEATMKMLALYVHALGGGK